MLFTFLPSWRVRSGDELIVCGHHLATRLLSFRDPKAILLLCIDQCQCK